MMKGITALMIVFCLMASCSTPAETAKSNFEDFFTELRVNQKTMTDIQRNQYISRYNYLISQIKQYEYSEKEMAQIMAMADRASVWLTGEHSAFKKKNSSEGAPTDRHVVILPRSKSEAMSGIEIPSTKNGVSEQLLIHKAYVASYNERWLISNWIAWVMTQERAIGEETRYPTFEQDPQITGKSSCNEDYSRIAPMTRGHMVPAADMRWDSVAMHESFYLSNIIPQHDKLNNGKWKSVEEHMRKEALHGKGPLYICCGPIVDPGCARIGSNKVLVPKRFFKVVCKQRKGKWVSIGFIMPNDQTSGSMFNYAVCVDSIEKITGHDFFFNLPDDVEKLMESTWSQSDWS